MICKRCAKAGRKNAEQQFTWARELHLKCKHPGTCTCAHQTGDSHLNKEMIDED